MLIYVSFFFLSCVMLTVFKFLFLHFQIPCETEYLLLCFLPLALNFNFSSCVEHIWWHTISTKHLRALTHQTDGQRLVNVRLSMRMCHSSFCGVSRIVGTSRPWSAVFQSIQHIWSVEPVVEWNHSDWQFSSVHEKKNEESKQTAKRHETETLVVYEVRSFLAIELFSKNGF